MEKGEDEPQAEKPTHLTAPPPPLTQLGAAPPTGINRKKRRYRQAL